MADLFSLDLSYLPDDKDWLIGVDEVGRGPLAGPVTACAFALSRKWYEANQSVDIWKRVNDSKQLKELERLRLFQYAQTESKEWGWGFNFEIANASVEEIDALNILGATKLAMQRALERLEVLFQENGISLRSTDDSDMYELSRVGKESPVFIIVDGKPLKDFCFEHDNLIKGDSKSFAIALASIMAKVTRDTEMYEHHQTFPHYGWDKNKGYGTKVHRLALSEIGATPLHRTSFLKKLTVAKT